MEFGSKDIEVRLLVEAIFLKYGYDFRQYQPSAVKKRLEHHAHENKHIHLSEMIPELLHSKEYFHKLLLNMSVTVTEMFRNPVLFHQLRKKVVPVLKTYPYLNIWHAGCATGEEAYSMGIFLKEEGLFNRTQIYATDINEQSLWKGANGFFPLKEMQRYTHNYNQAGCNGSLGDYYHTKYKAARMKKELREKITFSTHNLVTDNVFSEMHLIVCKNVLIYFNNELQNKVLNLFTNSLCHNGFLCLGENESLDCTQVADQYEIVDVKAKIYKRKFLHNMHHG